MMLLGDSVADGIEDKSACALPFTPSLSSLLTLGVPAKL